MRAMAAEGAGLATPAVVLSAAVAGGVAARFLRMPTMLGYILAGTAVGLFRERLGISQEQIMPIADLGVVLLLFVVGIEFSLRHLGAAWKLAFVAAPLQVAISLAMGYGIGRVLGFEPMASAILGYAISMSSTALALKLITERHDIRSPFGVSTLTYAIVQDLSLVLGLGLLGVMAQGGGVSNALRGLGLNALVIVAALLLATRVMPYVLQAAARLRTRELFILVAVAICMGAAFGASLVGLSVAVGAFLAGLIISESEYSHAVVAEIIPFRDLFGSVFFVSVGMLLNPSYLQEGWVAILALSGTILLGKAALIALLTRATGQHPNVAITAGLALSQIGEFSFIVAAEGMRMEFISKEVYDLLVSATLITMVLSPLLFALEPLLSRWVNSSARFSAPKEEAPEHFKRHIILLGLGRVGQHILEVLTSCNTKVIAVDVSVDRLDRAKSPNVFTLYGDAANPWILRQCRPEYASAAIIAIPDSLEARAITEQLKRLNPDLAILARTHSYDAARELEAAGVTSAVMPEEEAAKVLARRALLRCGTDPSRIEAVIAASSQRWKWEEDLPRVQEIE